MTDSIVKQRQLVETLYDLTSRKRIAWEKSSYRYGFDAEIGSSTINLTSSPGEFDENDYTIKIFNDDHEEVDAFSDIDINEPDLSPNVGEFRNYYHLMETLFRSVKRQVSGADQALDEVLKALKSR